MGSEKRIGGEKGKRSKKVEGGIDWMRKIRKGIASLRKKLETEEREGKKGKKVRWIGRGLGGQGGAVRTV